MVPSSLLVASSTSPDPSTILPAPCVVRARRRRECRPSGRQLAQVSIRGVADLDKLGRDLLPLTEPGGHPVLRRPEQLAEIFGDVHERLFHRRVRTSSPGRAGVRLAIPAGRWSGPFAAFRHDSLLMNGALVSCLRSPVTFGRRCIPGRGVARRLHTPGMRPPRALRAGRIAASV